MLRRPLIQGANFGHLDVCIFTFFLLNLNSLLNKVHFVSDLCFDYGVNYFGLCETWLDSSIPSSVLDIPGYRFIRNDSPAGRRIHGVGVYIKECFRITDVLTSFPNTLGLLLSDFSVWVLLVYRPPSYTFTESISLLSYIENFCLDREVVLLGDFNLPTIDWSADIPVARSLLDSLFLSSFTGVGLKQWVTGPTFPSSESTLDLVFTSELDRLNSLDLLAPPPGCGHVVVAFDYMFSSVINENHLKYDWFSGDFQAMSGLLNDMDWDDKFMDLDVEGCYSVFLSILRDLFRVFIPIKIRSNVKPKWLRGVPATLRRERAASWVSYKTARAQFGRRSGMAVLAWFVFREKSINYKRVMHESIGNYEFSLIRSRDPKRLHGYLRSKRVGKPSIGPLFHNGAWLDSCSEMASCFADNFSSMFVAGSSDFPMDHQRCAAVFDLFDFSVMDVSKVLQSLKPSSGSGPDGVPSLFLQRCAGAVSYPLWLIFRKSLLSGCVPSDWKLANVLPLFKGGVHSSPLNYRAISLTSVCCKALERMLVAQLYEYLENNSVLSPHQYGFRAGRSVEEQLLYCYDYVTKLFDGGCSVDVVFFDYRKAFDVVDHAILIEKLSCIGINGVVLQWFRDFLSGRRMKVVVHGECSYYVDVTSGVPQGSVVGPLLFLVYVNHVVDGLNSNFCLFADDLKLYLASPMVRSGKDGLVNFQNILQHDIDLLYSRSSSWGLSFSVGKCARLNFCRNFNDVSRLQQYFIGNQPIPNVSCYRDLGVKVDISLKFHLHVNEIFSKASGIACSILRGTLCREPAFMREVFITHIRPIIEWSSTVWFTGYVGDSKKLESVQRRWTKRVKGFDDLTYDQRLKELDLYSIKGRLLRNDLKMVWKVLHGFYPGLDDLFILNANDRTRGHSYRLFIPRVSTDVRARFFSLRVLNWWNGLPEGAVSASSLLSFKVKLDVFLGEVLFEYD